MLKNIENDLINEVNKSIFTIKTIEVFIFQL